MCVNTKRILSRNEVMRASVSRLNNVTALIILLGLFKVIISVRVQGIWTPNEQNVQIVTKFGFQQTDARYPKASRGYIFGNITGQRRVGENPSLFMIVSQANIGLLQSSSFYGKGCGVLMEKFSTMGFEARCNPQGKADIFRWVPCPNGKLCKEEETTDDSSTLMPNSQLTMQIVEPQTPEYWFVVFIACHLNDNCTWQASSSNTPISYDLWLTNGNPQSDSIDPFGVQFSFDEQDATQMYLITLLCYLVLTGIIYRGKKIVKKRYSPTRLKVLEWIVLLKTIGVALQSLNMLVYSFDGQGVFLARLLGEVLRMFSTDLLCLLLLILARGWALSSSSSTSITPCLLGTWIVLSVAKFIFFCCNFIFVYDIMHDVDIFTSWPGHGMLIVRLLFAAWFLLEVRVLIKREKHQEKATFLAHFGAGFLVWFVYVPGLGVVAHFISLLWRFRIILGITTLANLGAICCLLHIFWPNSQYRRFFGVDYGHVRATRTDSTDLEDIEHLLYSGNDSASDDDSQSHALQLI